MPKVRANSQQRWVNRTSAATPDYKAGVANPRTPWQAATVAAAATHSAAMTAAIQNQSFLKGVQGSSDAVWASAATGKGADRFAGGVAAGANAYQTGVAKYTQVIENTVLPARGPKGDPRNFQRVVTMANALRAAKTGKAAFSSIGLLVVVALLLLGAVVAVKAVVAPERALMPTEPREILCGQSRSVFEGASGGDGGKIAGKGKGKAAGGFLAPVLIVGVGMLAFALSGAAIDTVSATVTAPGAVVTAMAAVAGDSLVTRNAPLSKPPICIAIWAKSQASGVLQFTHPSGHDQVRDLRFRHVAATPINLLPFTLNEGMQPQELITLSMSGSAVGGQTELAHLMMYYTELGGILARLIDKPTLVSRMTELVTIEDTTTATLASTYSGPRALNAGSDLLIANTDYALLGYSLGAVCGCLTIRGADSGNLRIPMPGFSGNNVSGFNWFVWLSEETGLPLIPVFNSANKAGIFIENVQDQALAAVPFSLLFARLSP